MASRLKKGRVRAAAADFRETPDVQLGLRAFPSTSVVPEVPSKRLVSVRLVEYSLRRSYPNQVSR